MHVLAHKMGIKTRTGKQLSYQQSINLLRNPIYAGLIKTSMLDNVVVGLHEGLITQEEHKEILRKTTRTALARPSESLVTDWPLRASFISCADCGSKITGSSSKGRSKHYDFYHCPNCKAKNVGHRVSISREQLHTEFEELLRRVTPTKAHMQMFKKAFISQWNQKHKDSIKLEKKLFSELQTLESKRHKIIDLFVEDKLSLDEKNEQLESLESTRVRTTMQLNEAKSNSIDVETVLDIGTELLLDSAKAWRLSTPREKKVTQWMIFPKGLVYQFDSGFRTPILNDLYLLMPSETDLLANNSNVVGVDGIEPSTKRL